MGIPSLPLEIKIQIVSDTSHRRELLNLLACDTTFRHICQPLLYRWFKLQTGTEKRRTIQWCDSIVQNPHLALHVQEVTVQSPCRICRNQQGVADGAIERLIIDALNCLKNLLTFRFEVHPESHLLCLFVKANLEFPCLLSYRGVAPTSFLARHNSLKKVQLLDLSWELKPLTGILPELVCFSGSLEHIEYLDRGVRLLRLKTTRSRKNHDGGFQKLEHILHVHGASLRLLHLALQDWRKQDVYMISKCAPNLESLHIELVAYPPSALGKVVLDDILTINVQMKFLQSFKVIAMWMSSDSYVLPESQELQYVHRLHEVIPSIRVVDLSSFATGNACGNTPKSGWRYDGISKQWISPRVITHKVRGRGAQRELSLMEERYRDAKPEMSNAHTPLLEWRPLNKRWK